MKKLSLLMALLVCFTITGVYAAWSYAGSNDIVDGYAEIKATIAEATLTGANGEYKVESNLVLIVDEGDGKTAVLDFQSNNNEAIFLKVTFTPDEERATPEIKANGVESELYFTTSTTMQYGGTDIFKFVNPGDIAWEQQPDGSFTYTMDKAALEDAISLNGEFVLSTKTEHDNFRTALGGNIVARVTDGIVN